MLGAVRRRLLQVPNPAHGHPSCNYTYDVTEPITTPNRRWSGNWYCAWPACCGGYPDRASHGVTTGTETAPSAEPELTRCAAVAQPQTAGSLLSTQRQNFFSAASRRCCRASRLNEFLTRSLDHRPMSRIDLERVREWVNAKLSASQESQAAGHQYMKLRATVDAILAKVDCAISQSADVPRETPRRKAHLRLVWSRCSPDTPQLHQADDRVRLPM
jgi:hypothetical protein